MLSDPRHSLPFSALVLTLLLSIGNSYADDLAPAATPSSTIENTVGTDTAAATPASAEAAPAATDASDIQGGIIASAPGTDATEATAEGEQAAAPEEVASAILPHDLSPMGMFMAADWVVKAVMLGLAFASVVTWTLALGKGVGIFLAKRRAKAVLARIGESGTLREALAAVKEERHSGGVMVRAAEYELVLSARHEAFDKDGVKERVGSRLHRIEAQAARQINVGTGILATIGSTSPFVGLFGTVWGIMNSFIGISKTQTTNLAVVAPGIAEALLATAIGLVAAIPAVVLYNHFARSISGYKAIMADTSAEVGRIVSRDLDRQPIATPLRKVGS